eukprot:CAMPEP_0172727194 /NCGR_PEP_ID=MMETSP1074-20121228/91541_1 /TAXON_ID=2916 /ORGANISM="Ceratium fusus, Strain PA161109" /LENGTH=127 /DNA_ID=CAMNT_0013554319 /DNA_START=65 /DNA_END=448 /DNA_ORIENTATION=-
MGGRRVVLPALVLLLAAAAAYGLTFAQSHCKARPNRLRGGPLTRPGLPREGVEPFPRRWATGIGGVAVLGFIFSFPGASRAEPDKAKEKLEKAAESKAERIARQRAKLEEEAKKDMLKEDGTLKKGG